MDVNDSVSAVQVAGSGNASPFRATLHQQDRTYPMTSEQEEALDNAVRQEEGALLETLRKALRRAQWYYRMALLGDPDASRKIRPEYDVAKNVLEQMSHDAHVYYNIKLLNSQSKQQNEAQPTQTSTADMDTHSNVP
jgi:hypothetical protein